MKVYQGNATISVGKVDMHVRMSVVVTTEACTSLAVLAAEDAMASAGDTDGNRPAQQAQHT